MRWTIAVFALALAACGGDTGTEAEPEPVMAETTGTDETAAAPARVMLQPIGFPEIEANTLYGASCAYSAGDSMAALVIAKHDAAHIKIDGSLISLAPADTSQELAYGSRSAYTNADLTLALQIGEDGSQVAPEVTRATGSLTLTDSGGAELFTATGAVQCGV